jgi:hypothetical protein
MLPPRKTMLPPPSVRVRARFDPAAMAPDERHFGFGLRLRGWLSRLWRPAEPQRQRTSEAGSAPPQPVETEPQPVARHAAHGAIVQDITAPAAADEPVLPRVRRTLRLDPARDDSDWRWPSSARGG